MRKLPNTEIRYIVFSELSRVVLIPTNINPFSMINRETTPIWSYKKKSNQQVN